MISDSPADNQPSHQRLRMTLVTLPGEHQEAWLPLLLPTHLPLKQMMPVIKLKQLNLTLILILTVTASHQVFIH